MLKLGIPKRVDILYLVAVYDRLWSSYSKVILFSNGNFKDAYTIAAFGYTSLIICRLVKRQSL